MKIKRFLAAAAACMMAFSATACGSTVGGSSPASSEASQAEVTYSETPDTLDGLCTSLTEHEFLRQENRQEMASEFIGAKKGYKFQFDKVTMELYEFDPENLDETAKTTLESARTGNKITVFGKEVSNVHVSDSGKYLMIYNNGDNSEDAKKRTEELITLFTEYKKA